MNTFISDAMRDFALAKAKWYSTWPTNVEDRALVVYVFICLSLLMSTDNNFQGLCQDVETLRRELNRHRYIFILHDLIHS